MCKYVLLILLVLLVALMVVAALVVQEYGWVGFLVLLGALVVLGYIARRLLPRFFAYMLTRPLREMGKALRGARIVVHLIAPCDPPSREFDNDDDPEAIDDIDSDGEPDADESPFGPLDWYLLEFTVVPPDGGSSEGRVAHRRAWTPQLIGAVGPRPPLGSMSPFRGWPPPDQFTMEVQNLPAEVWNGYEYDTPTEALFGEQRLCMRVGVTRSIRAVTIAYAQFTNLGVVELPRIDVPPGEDR